jgi:hypothetical protein
MLPQMGVFSKAVWEDCFLLICLYSCYSIYCNSRIDTRCHLVLQKPDSKRHDAIFLYLHLPVRTQPELLNKGFDSRLMLNLRGTPFSALRKVRLRSSGYFSWSDPLPFAYENIRTQTCFGDWPHPNRTRLPRDSLSLFQGPRIALIPFQNSARLHDEQVGS